MKFSTMLQMVNHRAETQGDQIALTHIPDRGDVDQNITYAELHARAKAVAVRLQDLQSEGERVLLLFPCDLDYIIGFLGCIYAGAIAVPLYPPLSKRQLPRLQSIIENCSAKCALISESVYRSVQRLDHQFESLLQIPLIQIQQIDLWDAKLWRDPNLKPESIAFLQYTSGSTGAPKGVILNHLNLLSNFAMISQTMQVQTDDVFVGWLPLYHDMGLIGAVLHSLYAGTRTVFMNPITVVRPLKWLKTIERFKATFTSAPNFAYDLCVQKISQEQAMNLDLSSLRVAFNGAEPIREDTLKQFLNHFKLSGISKDLFLSCYGLAEATLIVSGRNLAYPTKIKRVDRTSLSQGRILECTIQNVNSQTLVGCGPSCDGVMTTIVDPETFEVLKPHQVGEVWVSGPNVAQGYWNLPAVTSATFVNHPTQVGVQCLRTGDMGFLDDQGELFITGRLKDLIIVRGKNFAPQDFEHLARSVHPLVQQGTGAAFSLQGRNGEEVILVQEVRGAQSSETLETLQGKIQDIIAQEYGVSITDIYWVKPSTLPKTSSGKIRRAEVKKRYLAGELERILPMKTEIPVL